MDYLNAGQVLAKNFETLGKHDDPNLIKKIDTPEYEDYDLKLIYMIDKVKYRLGNPGESIKQKIKQIKIDPEYVVDDLTKNITTISDLAKRQGFSLVFYLQPSLYNTKKELSEYETYNVEQDKQNLALFPKMHSEIYDLYRNELPKLAEREDFIFIDSD